MSANVLAFPSLTEGESRIPTPFYDQEGDEYTKVFFNGEQLGELGLYPGGFAVFLRGFHQDAALHLFTLDGRERVARLTWRGRMVKIGPDLGKWHRADELEVYGAMSELYAAGLDGPRSIVYREDRARLLAPLHPEQGMEYSLVSAAAH